MMEYLGNNTRDILINHGGMNELEAFKYHLENNKDDAKKVKDMLYSALQNMKDAIKCNEEDDSYIDARLILETPSRTIDCFNLYWEINDWPEGLACNIDGITIGDYPSGRESSNISIAEFMFDSDEEDNEYFTKDSEELYAEMMNWITDSLNDGEFKDTIYED